MRLNKKAYANLVQEDIEEVEKYFPKHSLEKSHIISILKWSIEALYTKEATEEYYKNVKSD